MTGQHYVNADKVFLPQSFRMSVLLQRKLGLEKVMEHAGGSVVLSNMREALGLTPVPQKTDRRKEREGEQSGWGDSEDGEGKGRGRKKGRNLPGLPEPKLRISIPTNRWRGKQQQTER